MFPARFLMCISLNPFIFREVLSPTTSWLHHDIDVLIPSYSGKFYHSWGGSLCFIWPVLIPSYSGKFYHNGLMVEWPSNTCLNPFIFREVLSPGWCRQPGRLSGLNPFIFREVLSHIREYISDYGLSLNPFIFREVLSRAGRAAQAITCAS